ncbi:MAG: tetratricopeptide repeat protein [Chloroflexi bacterium]|nr:tetratricopeptide repeat protein [Chloroflexota bacterium]
MKDEQTVITPTSFQTLGELLRYLRERAHLSQRELAARVDYHYSYISRLEKNVYLPDLAMLTGRFVPALELQNEPQWVARITELARKTPQPESSNSSAPVVFQSSEPSPVSLPIPFTLFLGRARETEMLAEMLRRPEIRLVTLVGPPGVGKTRLALHMAEQVSSNFKDGAALVDLMPVFEADQVLPAIALAVGAWETARVSILENVKNALRSKNVLIVVDNFEQVLDAAPQLLLLLSEAPLVKFLVTSREALRLRGEQEFPLAPLPVPGDADPNPQDFPSVQMFLQRARSSKPDFPLDEETASRAAEICRHLDGLPLAIELAAARVNVLSLSAMLKQFHRRFDWLTDGKRDLPAWRQNLWDAVEWSYALLDAQERVLLNRLSVFSGGWTLEAAEAICSDETICIPSDVLSLLIRLVDKSMITSDTKTDRFHFLETLREFARQKLKADNNLEPMRQRHASYFMDFMRGAAPNFDTGGDPARWLNRVEQDHNNLRAVLAWIIEDPARVPPAADFILAMGNFWIDRSNFTEGRRWMDRILAVIPELTAIRADLLRSTGDFYRIQGDYDGALAIEEESLAISKSLGYEKGMYKAMDGLAILSGIKRDYARAAELLEQVLVYRRRMKDHKHLTTTLNNLAIATRRLGNLERAKELYAEAISVTTENGNHYSLGHAMNGLAEVHADLKEYVAAIELQRQGLAVRCQLKDLKGIAFSLGSIAVSLHYLNRPALAAQLESASQKLYWELGIPIPASTKTEHDELAANLRANLGDVAFEDAWSGGQAISWEQAVALAA